MSEGVGGEVQNLANKIVDDAQSLANQAYDLGEEAAADAVGLVFQAINALTKTAESLAKAVVGGGE